jgi:UDP-N-acetylmuramoyl-tripeptide--D-alanyl-D-alanine ligase
MLTLADLVEALCSNRPGELSSVANLAITDAVVDSRQALPGALFVALPGEHSDGHAYLRQAFELGAVAALVQKDPGEAGSVLDLRRSAAQAEIDLSNRQPPFCLWVDDSLAALQQAARFWRRKLNVRVIGITGSVGKSTTKELVANVLERHYRTLKNPGNQNNEIGLPLTLLRLNESHERAVLEMGFYVPGEIALLCELALPEVGVITNIGTVHAERAGSQEEIARGKAELVQALPAGPRGVAILNYDDPLVRRMANQTQAQVFFYGTDPQAHLWADNLQGMGLDGIRFRLHYGKETLYLRVPMIGQHSVHTALRAAAVALTEGLTWQEIVDGLHSERTQLRLVTVRARNGALILDDTYNASPESTLAALNLLDELEGRKVAVLGDMLELGPYEKEGHEMVGIRVAKVADELVTVGELGRLIAAAARAAGLPLEAIHECEDALEATAILRRRLGPGDAVLVKGSRGMRMERIVTELEAA